MYLRILLCACLLLQLSAQTTDPAAAWKSEVAAGTRASGAGQYAQATALYRTALAKAEESQAAPELLLPILKLLAASLRTEGMTTESEQVLTNVLKLVQDLHGEVSVQAASAWSGLAMVQKAQDRNKEAADSISRAINIQSVLDVVTEEFAKDATLAASIQQALEQNTEAKKYYAQALALWGALPSSGLQILTVIDPLAGIYRDERDYASAEQLYTWALRLREAALGPKHSELISTLDGLAYVLFGQKKYAEAEPVYQRLLETWEGSAGKEHPMVALTLDKMSEFYSEQKLYDKAEPLVQRSQAIRTKALIETYHRTGRVLVGAKKLEEALDLYARVVRIGSEAKVPDEQMDGVLRTYAMLLQHAKREDEAAAVQQRVRDALIRRADREGRRLPPPPAAQEK